MSNLSVGKTFFATCPRGLEALLADELRALAATEVTPGRSGVGFAGELETAYRACLWSRVAGRVLLPLADFPAADGDQLYAGVRTIRWADHTDAKRTLAVDFTQIRSQLTHTQFGALRTKDAIVDQLRDETGARPSVDTAQPDVRINVHVEDDRATVSIDLSGDSLHRRGLRAQSGAAPLKENLAAALLLLLDWPRLAGERAPLCDPMCGTGTLLLEAALMAADEAPGLRRPRFGFHRWLGHDGALWQRLVAEARERVIRDPDRLPRLYGSDADRDAIAAARANVARGDFAVPITLAVRKLADLEPPEGRGLVITNPPYGERLGDARELAPLYRLLGDLLKRRFPGWRAGVLTGNLDLIPELGLRSSRRHIVWNGAIECRLVDLQIAADGPRDHSGPTWRKPKPLTAGAEMFRNRLEKNQKHLLKWAKREGVTCLRLYDADLPEYAVAVDRYEDAAQVQEYAPPKTVDAVKARDRLDEVMRVVPEVLGLPPERVLLKVRRRQRPETQYGRTTETGVTVSVEAHEGGHLFACNLSDYLDTGLFLDHRTLRQLVAELAPGKSFLNLFGYTATATVYAAKAGATRSTSVDLSQTYLDWAARNLALNRVDPRRHELVRDDVLAFLPAEKRRYGLILLTPPTFSNSKRMDADLDVQRDHPTLIQQAAARLDEGGVLLFSTHFRRFKMDPAALEGLAAEDWTRRSIPPDFARDPRIHQLWKITRA